VAILVATLALSSMTLFCGRLVRMARHDAARTARAVTASPWNDIEAVPARRGRILAVLALEDEMLVELLWEPTGKGDAAEVVDLVGPSSIAAIVMLSRWRDARSTVIAHELRGRYLLHTAQSRVAMRASPVSG
jgi:hypothetical protein